MGTAVVQVVHSSGRRIQLAALVHNRSYNWTAGAYNWYNFHKF